MKALIAVIMLFSLPSFAASPVNNLVNDIDYTITQLRAEKLSYGDLRALKSSVKDARLSQGSSGKLTHIFDELDGTIALFMMSKDERSVLQLRRLKRKLGGN